MNTPLPDFPLAMLPDGWQVEFLAPPITIDDAVRVTLPDGRFWMFFKTGNPGEQIAPFIYSLLESLARASAGAVGMSELLDKMSGSKRLQGATLVALRKFLDVAAGEGYEFDGVDAASLYIDIFGEQNDATHPRYDRRSPGEDASPQSA